MVSMAAARSAPSLSRIGVLVAICAERDIVVEIMSPKTAVYDMTTKSDTYQAMGVREMWLVDTDVKQIVVRSFEAGKSAVYKPGDILRSEVLPKIEIPVATLFGSA